MSNRNLPVGTRDEFGPTAQLKERVQTIILNNFRSRGFQRITTPLLEYREVFGPLATQAAHPYQLLDEYGDTLVLRPDLTLPIARVMSTTGVEPPVKWYYSGDVFRVQKRHAGGYNQITQAGLEIIGYPSLRAEWECLVTAITAARELRVQDMTIELGQAEFVKLVLAALPLTEVAKAALQRELFAKNLTAYAQLIEPLRATEFFNFLAEWPWLFGDFADVLDQLDKMPSVAAINRIIADLRRTRAFLASQYPNQRVTLDLSVPAPQDYYTGMIFHAYSPNAPRFLFSGGRYDRLLASFQKTMQPAVGLAFDVDAVVAQMPVPPAASTTLIYFADDQWNAALALQQRTPDSELCLVESRTAAVTMAARRGATLIDLTQTKGGAQ